MEIYVVNTTIQNHTISNRFKKLKSEPHELVHQVTHVLIPPGQQRVWTVSDYYDTPERRTEIINNFAVYGHMCADENYDRYPGFSGILFRIGKPISQEEIEEANAYHSKLRQNVSKDALEEAVRDSMSALEETFDGKPMVSELTITEPSSDSDDKTPFQIKATREENGVVHTEVTDKRAKKRRK